MQGMWANYLTPMVVADANFFEILKVPFLYGNPATALRGAEGLALSRSEALRRFGGINVVGQTVTAIRRGERYELRVTGVFEDLPKNSQMNFEMVGRISEQNKEALAIALGTIAGHAIKVARANPILALRYE